MNSGKPKKTTEEEAQDFIRDVFPAEMEEITARRDILGAPSPPNLDGPKAPSSNYDLVGLALSGGGIRSATLNLGILQGMTLIGSGSNSNHPTMLRFFDYLSTVSGGGYIGSWLSAWILRSAGDPKTSFLSVEENLKRLAAQNGNHDRKAEAVTKPEAPQIDQLRKFSNYLTPKLGLFSVDTWTLIATYGRNFLLNQIILFAALTALLLVPQGLVRLLQLDDYSGGVLAFLGALACIIGLTILWSTALGTNALAYIAKQTAVLPAGQKKSAAFTPWKLHCRICSPLLLAAILLASVFAIVAAAADPQRASALTGFKADIAGLFPVPSAKAGDSLLLVWALAFALFNLTGYVVSALWIRWRATPITPRRDALQRWVVLRSMGIAFVTGAFGEPCSILSFAWGLNGTGRTILGTS